MSDEVRVNRPMQAPQAGGTRPEMMAPQEPRGGGSRLPWIILVLVVLVIVLFGFLFRDKLFKGSSQSMQANTDKPSGYQAVFLTNGQVYFGKISGGDSNYVTLKDIYYLQVIQQPPIQGTPQAGQTPANQQQQISLVKLGQELHGPVDEMHISRAQILFYEDLKESGSVVKAIQAYKANPSGTTPPPAPSPASAR